MLAKKFTETIPIPWSLSIPLRNLRPSGTNLSTKAVRLVHMLWRLWPCGRSLTPRNLHAYNISLEIDRNLAPANLVPVNLVPVHANGFLCKGAFHRGYPILLCAKISKILKRHIFLFEMTNRSILKSCPNSGLCKI